MVPAESPELLIYPDLIKKLHSLASTAEPTAVWLLYGYHLGQDIQLTSVARLTSSPLAEKVDPHELEYLQALFPGGITCQGLFKASDWKKAEGIAIYDNYASAPRLYMSVTSSDSLTAGTNPAEIDDSFSPRIRVVAVDVPLPAVTVFVEGSVTACVYGDGRVTYSDDPDQLCDSYRVRAAHTIISRDRVIQPHGRRKCKNLLELLSQCEPSIKPDKFEKTCLHVDMVSCGPIENEQDPIITPTVTYHPGGPLDPAGTDCRAVTIPLNAVAMVPPTDTPEQTYVLLSQAVQRQLQLIAHYYKSKPSRPCPQSFHFDIPGSGVPITVLFPAHLKENHLDMVELRGQYQCALALPTTSPLLLRLAALNLMEEPSEHLVNVHTGLSSPDAGAQLSVVRGRYSYYHYMQDRMDDDKWGCAYRSLQTICSWYRHQGFTLESVPSHRKIQETLVAVGDKPKKFIGSKQWIGSMEVSYCLDKLLNVTSRIMYVSSGSELADKGRELQHHFETQGTPVMIGGGVLAHTILGLSFNEMSGDIHFLVLDPHYIGKEDRKLIQTKGWCSWKKPSFWRKDCYYNLCMPQVPTAGV